MSRAPTSFGSRLVFFAVLYSAAFFVIDQVIPWPEFRTPTLLSLLAIGLALSATDMLLWTFENPVRRKTVSRGQVMLCVGCIVAWLVIGCIDLQRNHSSVTLISGGGIPLVMTVLADVRRRMRVRREPAS